MRAPPTHPPYIQMIKKALSAKIGNSREAILKFIMENYDVGGSQARANGYLKKALTRAVASGDLKQVKGVGASGSFKLDPETKPTATRNQPRTKDVVKEAPKKLKPTGWTALQWERERAANEKEKKKKQQHPNKQQSPSEHQSPSEQQPPPTNVEGKKKRRKKKKNRSGGYKRARKNFNAKNQKEQ
uniref:H15 domain-containing protein n=1 Tax=Globodera pallida TaxID=36090 RepID=A0A183CA73_GLOPA